MIYDLSEIWSFIESPPAYPNNFSGRGIVIGGGGAYLPSTYLAVKSIRNSGCKLPIEIWHLGPMEFPAPLHSIFNDAGATCVDAHQAISILPMKKLGGWENKPFAIAHSKFLEVMYIDADNLALQDPSPLFDSKEYLENGSIFWPDFYTRVNQYWSIKPGAWELLKLKPQEGAEIESGQLLINKEKCWKELMVTLHMNANSDFYYTQCTHGDKDTFNLAWRLVRGSPFVVSKRPRLQDEMVRIQYGLEGEELFQHGRKWVLPVEKNTHLPNYRLESECVRWLKEFSEFMASFSNKE